MDIKMNNYGTSGWTAFANTNGSGDANLYLQNGLPYVSSGGPAFGGTTRIPLNTWVTIVDI